MLQVALLRDFDEPRLFGIRYYAERLRRAIAGRCVAIDVYPRPRTTAGPKAVRALVTLAVKEIVYPLQVRRLRADVAHVLDQSHAHLARWLRDSPTVVTCHDLWGLRHGSRLRRAAYRRRVRGLLGAGCVIAVSEATREELISVGVDSTRIRLVRNRVDPFFAATPSEIELRRVAERFDLDGRRYVLHVGNNLPYKNLERLLGALGEVARATSDPPLLVKVGAELSPTQRRLAGEQRVAVRWLGEVSTLDLRALYHRAQCLAYPSLYEGFGWPVAEALACGLPVIASKAGALPEITGDAALLVDPQETQEIAAAIRRVIESRTLHEELSQRGRKRAAGLAEGDGGAEVIETYRVAAAARG